MSLNFNVDPYYDDFDPTKNFHRILFKPGYAVQARELTQSQTIIQDQITKFADNIFRQNTPVSGGKITTNLNCSYLKLNTEYQGIQITASDFLGKTVVDVETGTILAKVIATEETSSTSTTIGDPPTLIISYLSGMKFTDGLEITVTDGTNLYATTVGTLGENTCTGKSSAVSISEGVFYVVNGYSQSSTQNEDGTFTKYSIGNFVSVQPQTIVLNKYDNVPSYRVGLQITETIVDSVNDTSLLDPAIGASNYQGPGADRYQVTLTLSTLPLALGDDDRFIELLKIENGTIIKQVDGTVYSVIDDYFAKRTFEESGDYIVNNFKLTPSTDETDNTKYNINVGKGVAYVRGYRLENQSSLKISGNRARQTSSINNNSVFVDYGNYLYVNTVKGSATNNFDISTMPTVDFHIVPTSNINSANATSYASTLVATGRIRNLDFDHFKDTTANTNSYVYKASVFDVDTKVLSSNVKTGTTNTIQFFDTGTKFSSANSAYVGATITIDSGASSGDSRKIIAYNGVTKTATVDATFSVIPTGTSKFSLRFNVKDIETLAITDTSYNVLASAIVDESSKVGGLSTGDTQLKDTSYPELLFKIGNSYVKSLSDTSYYSKKTFRNKAFSSVGGAADLQLALGSGELSTLDFQGRTSTPLSSSEITELFTVIVKNPGTNVGLQAGQILDFTPLNRTVVVSSDKNTVTFHAPDLTTPLVVDIITKVSVSDASDSNHVLKIKNLRKANESDVFTSGSTIGYTNVNLLNGQVYIQNAGIVGQGAKQSLYVSDVKRIVKIIDTLDKNVTPTVDMLSSTSYDVTRNYAFSNGQTDNYYDHASITLRPGAAKAKGNLLVLFDYYAHGGGDGYFSIMSYQSPTSSSPEKYEEIPNYVAKNGQVYSLRDCLDFRPSRVNATNTFAFEYTTDPTSSDSGCYIPDNLTNFLTSYEYYLAKKDLLVLTKDKSFQIIEGSSSVNPTYPVEPDGSLLIGKINLDPYTAYIPGENPVGTLPNMSIETVQHKRWTMQDISNLQNRINNIEYYTALNVLEQKANALQVPDVNGLNRFKNGILVDDFSSFSTADTANPDFSASINKRTRQLTAAHNVTNFPLYSTDVLNSGGNLTTDAVSYKVNSINKTTNLFTLPYTTANVTSQKLASSVINVNPYGVSIQQGVLDLNPPMDNWVDNTKAPDLLIVDPALQVFQQSDTVNVLSLGDWKVVPGTTQTTVSQVSSSFSRVNHGAFNGPFGSVVGYTQTDTTTTTSTYGTLSQVNTLGYYSNIGSTYSLNNNYITDISILPYIRPQQLLIKSKGLLVNTPLSTWFDGVKVDDYMTNPDIVELDGVTGSFTEGDTLGYYNNNKFYPIATIVAVYVYPGTSKVRLYITGNYHTSYLPPGSDLPVSKLQNAFFNAAGVFQKSTATGNVTTTKVINLHKSGYVGAVGGNFTDILGSTLRYYRVWVNHGGFADKFGIWGRPNAYGNLPAGKFSFTTAKTGTHYMRVSTDDAQVGYIKVDGITYWTSSIQSGGYNDFTFNLTAGTHTFEIMMNTTEDDGDAYVSCAISASPWASETSTNGPIVLSTDALKGATAPTQAGTQIEMPGGGLYYVGVTKLSLNGIANSTDNFYTGSKITFNSVYISVGADGKSTVTPQTFTATITNYVGATCTCTLDTPVNISVGGNAIIGGMDTTSFYTINGTFNNYLLGLQKGGPAKLSTDEAGTFVGIFNIPEGKFKTGDRVFRVDNRQIDNEPSTATTYAEATFTASGLATRSQALDFGPSVSGAKNTFTQTSYLSNQLVALGQVTSTTYQPYDPVAQTFIISKDNYPNGLFLDSISVFFKTKPGQTTTVANASTSNAPITLSIVGTSNGYPNGETLDYSIVTLSADQVKTSANPQYLDPATRTTFKFPAPVYIQAGVLYAFILKSPSTEYNVYLAGQGGTAIPSSAKNLPTDPTPTVVTKIGTAPYVGSLFESQNGMTWQADISRSLMMVIDRCVFDTTPVTVPFSVPIKLPYRRGAMDSVKYFLDANSAPNFMGTYVGRDVESHAFNVTTTDFVPTSTNVNYSFNATLKNGQNKVGDVSVTPGKYGSPTYDDIYLSDGLGERILLANTTNSFLLDATLSSSDDSVSPIIADDGLSVYNIQWNINNLELSNSQIVIKDGGTGYEPTVNVFISAPDIAGGTQALAVANVVSNTISSIVFTNTGSGYLKTPTVIIDGANTTPAQVEILSEFSPHGGNALCKYFTKKVVLAEGNDSQDLRVYYTAYKPTGTNIYVFYKLLNKNDSSNFDDNGWQLMTDVGANRNVYSTTRDDLYEFECAPGASNLADNYITYVSANGQTYDSFVQFAIKIVMTTPDKTTVPFLTDLRALALPSGTGV